MAVLHWINPERIVLTFQAGENRVRTRKPNAHAGVPVFSVVPVQNTARHYGRYTDGPTVRGACLTLWVLCEPGQHSPTPHQGTPTASLDTGNSNRAKSPAPQVSKW